MDGGVPRLTSTAMLEVRVLDENDNAPEVIQPLQEVITVREKQPPGEERVSDVETREKTKLLLSCHEWSPR